MDGRLQVAAAFFAAFSLGCEADAPNEQAAPEFAFTAFRTALLSGSGSAIWPFLGPDTQAALEARAASNAAAGDVARSPGDLITAAWVPMEADIATLERVSFDDASAVLRLTTVLGETSDVHMARVDGAWRIELALPADPEASDG